MSLLLSLGRQPSAKARFDLAFWAIWMEESWLLFIKEGCGSACRIGGGGAWETVAQHDESAR